MLFTDVDFLDRFDRAAQAGFMGVECQFPYQWPKEQLAEKLDQNKLEFVLHNITAGDFAAGERGIANHPNRVSEFQEGVGRAIEYAKALKCPRLNVIVGLIPRDVPAEKARSTLVNNLRFTAEQLKKEGIVLLVEALNLVDIPGFHLSSTRKVLDLFKEIGHPNLYLQYDVYHMQIMEGDLTRTIRNNLAKIGHIQIADNPGRNEPGSGEINFDNLFRFIDEAGYKGWIGCEYKPVGKTEDGLGWIKPYVSNLAR